MSSLAVFAAATVVVGVESLVTWNVVASDEVGDMNAMQSFRSRAIAATFLLVSLSFSPAIIMSMSLCSGSANAVE